MTRLGEGIAPPADLQPATLLEWSGERYHDLCDGTIADRQTGWYVWNAVMGYADRPMTANERRQLFVIAGQISDFLRSNFPEGGQ